MGKHLRYLVLGGGLEALLLAAVACSTDLKPVEDRVGAVEQSVSALQTKAGKIAAPAKDVEFVVTGVEWKGATSIDSLAAPTTDPKTLSSGYRYKAPGEFEPTNPKRWEVSSYVWSPGAMTALQGDKITLRTFIINGDEHAACMEAPDGTKVVQAQNLNRGRQYLLTFTAAQAGTYKLICGSHAPTMTAAITVLPRS